MCRWMGRPTSFFQGSDQLLGRVGLEEAGHVLDAQQMGAPASQLLGHVHVVFEGIFIPLGVENVAGVAQGGLAQLALLEHLVHGYLHAGNPVQESKIRNTSMPLRADSRIKARMRLSG